MTTKELITASIINDIINDPLDNLCFRDMVNRVYDWLLSLGFEATGRDCILTDNSYHRVYNHPKYGTISANLNKRTMLNDIKSFVELVVNLEEPAKPVPTAQPASIFSFVPMSKENVDCLCEDYANKHTTIGAIIDWLYVRCYGVKIDASGNNDVNVIIHNKVGDKGNTAFHVRDTTDFDKIFKFVVIDSYCLGYLETYRKQLQSINPIELQEQVNKFAAHHGYTFAGCNKNNSVWQHGNESILVPNASNAVTQAEWTLYYIIFDIQWHQS